MERTKLSWSVRKLHFCDVGTLAVAPRTNAFSADIIAAAPSLSPAKSFRNISKAIPLSIQTCCKKTGERLFWMEASNSPRFIAKSFCVFLSPLGVFESNLSKALLMILSTLLPKLETGSPPDKTSRSELTSRETSISTEDTNSLESTAAFKSMSAPPRMLKTVSRLRWEGRTLECERCNARSSLANDPVSKIQSSCCARACCTRRP
mmetsp:Transcript_1802/g.3103  ORF Transcript_1802/g.3103 Transcript_1802/m.3103 type:complete len:206 (-) Transcript_1802:112-729(-)